MTSLSCAAEAQEVLVRAAGRSLETMERVESDSELLFFFLHLVNRFAFSDGGTEARDRIQDALAHRTIEGVLRASWDTTKGDTGFDSESWLRRMHDEQISNLNNAEMEYGECSAIVEESQLSTNDTVVGRLVVNVLSAVDATEDVLARAELEALVLRALSQSGLRSAVKSTVSAIVPHASS